MKTMLWWLLAGCAPAEDTSAPVEECPSVCDYLPPVVTHPSEPITLDWSGLDRALDGTPTSPDEVGYLYWIAPEQADQDWACEAQSIPVIGFDVFESSGGTSATFDWGALGNGYDGHVIFALLDKGFDESMGVQGAWSSILMHRLLSETESGTMDAVDVVFPEDYPADCLP